MRTVPRTTREKALLALARRLADDFPHFALVEGDDVSDDGHIRVGRDGGGILRVGVHDGDDSIVFADTDGAACRSRSRPVSASVRWCVERSSEVAANGSGTLFDLVDGHDLAERAMPYVDRWRTLRMEATRRTATHPAADFRLLSALLMSVAHLLPEAAAARLAQFVGGDRQGWFPAESRYEDIVFLAVDPVTGRLVDVEPHAGPGPMSEAFGRWASARARLHCEAWGRVWDWLPCPDEPLECLDFSVTASAGVPMPDPDLAERAFARVADMRCAVDRLGRDGLREAIPIPVA